MLNEDYKDMLQCLFEEKVRFLLVGAYAVAVYGYPRATKDMGVFVLPEWALHTLGFKNDQTNHSFRTLASARLDSMEIQSVRFEPVFRPIT
jgi:hypothetical protein